MSRWGVLTQEEADYRRRLSEIWERYMPIMKQTARRVLIDPDYVDDVLQDCAERFIAGKPRLPVSSCGGDGDIVAFLVYVVKKRALDCNRRLARQAKHRLPLDVEDLESDVGTLSLDERIQSLEQAADFARSFERLSETDQTLLIGRYVMGQTDEELARYVGCKPNSVRMKLTRARERVKKLMREDDEDDR